MGVVRREAAFWLMGSFFDPVAEDRRTTRLHAGEPVRLSPAVAAKEKEPLRVHAENATRTHQTT
ncbi:hypothetical protein GCM10023353_12660 [Tomitella cavernea]|uniref:Uncharacterized protein n=1 Tax=Tomitella cavernea TaxID=1387982 RepID=A0ABP9CL61_9ACTN